MEYEIYKSDDELYHWGIKGMKWGIRRYQNPDGTLTAAGRKRYNAELAKVREQEKIVKNREAVKGRMDRLKARQDEVAARKKALDDAESNKAAREAKKAEREAKKAERAAKKAEKEARKEAEEAAKKAGPPKNKPVSKMTDEELAAHIRRIQMEKQYESLTAKPETTKKGNNFVKDFMSRSVTPAIQEASKQLIQKKLLDVGEKKLGLKKEAVKPVVDSLREEYQTLNYTKQILKTREELANMKAAEQAKQAAKEAKSSGSSVSNNTVSSGKNYVNNAANFPAKPSSANVSSGQSFVGKFDRASIADLDRGDNE